MTSFSIFPGTFTSDGRKVSIKECKWKTDATRDPSIIEYWKKTYANKIKFWGVPTGPDNGILVLDVDIKDDNGFETIKKYHLPLTMSQITRSGGRHFIFKYPQDGNIYGNRTKFDKGLDIRGQGGYIVYYGFDSTPIANAPSWLLKEALSKKSLEISNGHNVKISAEIVTSILNNSYDNIINAPIGESNNILNIEAYNIGQLLPSNSIDYQLAFDTLFKAAKERGKPDYEARATIESGFKGGSNNPIQCPFENTGPILHIPTNEINERWTPTFFTNYDLSNMSKLRKPQVFKNWSTTDIQIITADGGTGKTTLKLYESICLALGENFLGFECTGEGRTLYITGEDTREKLGAMIGVITKQMGIYEDKEKLAKIRNNILVKKDSDICLITKNKYGFITINSEALEKIMQAVDDLKPKMIVFDPISSFWGSEAALNDMSRAVAKFMSALVERSDACVEIINHMGKQSSNDKDMTQFAGRGGTGLPSHSRVSKVLRSVFEEEFQQLTGLELGEEKSAIMCNVNKFSDGSPLYNKPFLIIREGYLFSKLDLIEQKVKEEQNKMSDIERIFTFIKTEITDNRYPTKDVIVANFMASSDKITKERIVRALSMLSYTGHIGEKIKLIENPDVEAGGKVYVITDMKGKEC